MKTIEKKLIQVSVLLVIFLVSSAAHAWTSDRKWGGTSVTLRLHQNMSSGSYRTAMDKVLENFNDNPSRFRLQYRYNDSSVGLRNGQNEVWFTSSSSYSPAATITRRKWWNLDEIRETDVVFYSGVSWTSSMDKTTSWAYGGSRRTIQTTAMHEFGHVAGLGHEADEYNIMGQDWTHVYCNAQTLGCWLGEDASDGLADLYGLTSGDVEDFGATVFKHTGNHGEYSTHGFCQMYYFHTTDLELPYSIYEGQRRYQVLAGMNVRAEFTFENNGKTTQEVRAGYYISTNDYVSTYDRLIATTRPTLGRNDVYTTKIRLTIPADLAPGTYYLGVILDDDNAVLERDGGNNVAYHIIEVIEL
jgi:hypothetical protein